MRRRHSHDGGSGKWQCRPVALAVALACVISVVVYLLLWPVMNVVPQQQQQQQNQKQLNEAAPAAWLAAVQGEEECCRGIANLEFWGSVVRSAEQVKVESSHGCCSACKALCSSDKSCECNTWVYCADRALCADSFGECWLKKQKKVLEPEVHNSGKEVGWTSGLIYGPNQGIVALEIPHGVIRIKLLPECAPLSVTYILELLTLRHCAGCQIYRAESRGALWDDKGDLVKQGGRGGQVGPPYALVQGVLAPSGTKFPDNLMESHQRVQRGMVGWVEGGPHFFISLANHDEWQARHAIFGQVLAEDMAVVEELAALPTRPATWSGITAAVLTESVRIIKVRKAESADKHRKSILKEPSH